MEGEAEHLAERAETSEERVRPPADVKPERAALPAESVQETEADKPGRVFGATRLVHEEAEEQTEAGPADLDDGEQRVVCPSGQVPLLPEGQEAPALLE